jgi:hypothetical protein
MTPRKVAALGASAVLALTMTFTSANRAEAHRAYLFP